MHLISAWMTCPRSGLGDVEYTSTPCTVCPAWRRESCSSLVDLSPRIKRYERGLPERRGSGEMIKRTRRVADFALIELERSGSEARGSVEEVKISIDDWPTVYNGIEEKSVGISIRAE